MGQVQATINGRSYRLNCSDGQEQRLSEVAAFVGQRVDQLAKDFGQVGDIRLLLMAALMTADELFDLREQVAAKQEAAAKAPRASSGVIETNLTALKRGVSLLPL